MACDHFRIATINRRKSRSFGTFPIHLTEAGKSEWLFHPLPDPFYGADFRDYQVVMPDFEQLEYLPEVECVEHDAPSCPLLRQSSRVLGCPQSPSLLQSDHGLKMMIRLIMKITILLDTKFEQSLSSKLNQLYPPIPCVLERH